VKDISKYIYESIFDEEDIMDKMDDVVTIDRWYEKLSDKDTYRKSFSELWTEVNKKCKCVRLSHIKSDRNYIVFQTRLFNGGLPNYASKQEYIILIKPYKNPSFIRKTIEGYFMDDQSGVNKGQIKAWESPKGRIENLLPRKSKYNNFSGRQIYEISPEMEWLVPLIDKLTDKLKR
jgi:hypothetical protein